jgi:hypothetical protein
MADLVAKTEDFSYKYRLENNHLKDQKEARTAIR